MERLLHHKLVDGESKREQNLQTGFLGEMKIISNDGAET